MTETHHLKNAVIFIQTILCFAPSGKITYKIAHCILYIPNHKKLHWAIPEKKQAKKQGG